MNINKCIGIIAPSFFIERKNDFNTGISVLKNLGAEIKFGKHVFSRFFNTTASAKERAEDINSMFADKNIDIIMASDGGCRAIEVLEYLDYDLIKRNPKPFCGFSDITHILLALNAKTGIKTIHGVDVINCFGAPNSAQKERNIKHFCNILNTYDEILLPQYSEIDILRTGCASGVAVGGWLEAVHNTYRTPYFPYNRDIILFLEAIDTELNKINMMLQSMRIAGMFNNVRGLIIGKLTNCDEKEYFDCSPAFDSIVMDACYGYDFPVIKNVDFGHKTEHLAIEIGSKIEINTDNNNIILNKRM